MTQDPSFAPMTVAGYRLALLADGPQRLEALVELIDGAEESLRVLYYIWDNDASSRRIRDALVRAAARGVKVSVLVDGFGAANASEAFFKPLVEGNAQFCRFVPRWGRRFLLRNHQKLALADGKRVIIGGFNIKDEYFGRLEDYAWRDLGLLVEGDSCSGLVRYFDDLLKWAIDPDATMRQLRRMLQRRSVTTGQLHWLFGGPTRRLSPWARAVRRDMRRARRLDIIAAYFAPGPVLLRRIASVARRGKVRLISAGRSDSAATLGAARYTYWTLLKRGVRIFEYQATRLHTKLFVIDDAVHIGSANFDMRSLFLNLEMMLRVDDARFAEAMRRFVDGEVADSIEVTRDTHRAQMTWYNRLNWAIGYFLVAVADYRITRRLTFRGESLQR